MAGLLSGLGDLGLENLEKMELYEETEVKERPIKTDTKEAPVITEEDFLFDKTYECPVCYKTIKERTVKTGRARVIRTEMNLRPVCESIEPLKYDAIVCPHCGYAALSRYFGHLTPSQSKAIKESISQSYHGNGEWQSVYSYEEAVSRYRLCLANAIVKKAKVSEKAYICLKAGWLLGSMQDNMPITEENYEEKQKEYKIQEREFLKNALEGLINARQTENLSVCGMDQTTVEYLIAVLAMEFEQYDISGKLIGNIIVSSSTNERMKERAREVKELLVAKMKAKK